MSDSHSSSSLSDSEVPQGSPKVSLKPSSSSSSQSRASTLEKIANLEFYGIYDEEFIANLANIFDVQQTFSPSVREARAPRPKDDSIRKSIINPPCFEQFKVPKVTGLASKRAQGFEKPLFDRAVSLRNILVPLTAASVLIPDDPKTSSMIIDFILDELTREFQKLNYDRIIAVTPDSDVRKALSLDDSHALRDDDVLDHLKSAKKLAKTFEKKKQSRAQRSRFPTGKGNLDGRTRTPSQDFHDHPAAELKSPALRDSTSSDPPGGSGRGRGRPDRRGGSSKRG
jgi:hypothetical protein